MRLLGKRPPTDEVVVSHVGLFLLGAAAWLLTDGGAWTVVLVCLLLAQAYWCGLKAGVWIERVDTEDWLADLDEGARVEARERRLREVARREGVGE